MTYYNYYLLAFLDTIKEKISSFFGGIKKRIVGGFSSAGAAAANVFHQIYIHVVPALEGIGGLLVISIKIGIAAFGLALIVFLRNLVNTFSTPGEPSRFFGNAAFGFLGIQRLGYVVLDILNKPTVASRLNIASFIMLGLGIVLSLRGINIGGRTGYLLRLVR